MRIHRTLRHGVVTATIVALTAGVLALSAAVATAQSPAPAAHGVQSEGLVGGLVGGVIDGLSNLIVKVVGIVGSLGGSLTNGRWHIDVPAGAFDGTASVGIGVPSGTSPSCHLQILPADKNHFQKPVKLTADCSNVPTDELKTYGISWYNPATQTWEPVAGSTVDLVHKTVSAPLQHFSAYSVGPVGGRAGW